MKLLREKSTSFMDFFLLYYIRMDVMPSIVQKLKDMVLVRVVADLWLFWDSVKPCIFKCWLGFMTDYC